MKCTNSSVLYNCCLLLHCSTNDCIQACNKAGRSNDALKLLDEYTASGSTITSSYIAMAGLEACAMHGLVKV
jgi:pentatricopeptide repeat protein